MLYAVMRLVETAVKATGCPYPFVFGPERLHGGPASYSRIVFERDTMQGDTVEAPLSQFRNPRQPAMRRIGCVVRVYCQSTLPGAGAHDHQDLADRVVDQLIVALRNVCDGVPTTLDYSSSRMLDAAALEDEGLEAWPGAVYELRCRIGRGVVGATWEGEAAEEATIGGTGGVAVTNRMTVGLQASGELPEPVAGG